MQKYEVKQRQREKVSALKSTKKMGKIVDTGSLAIYEFDEVLVYILLIFIVWFWDYCIYRSNRQSKFPNLRFF